MVVDRNKLNPDEKNLAVALLEDELTRVKQVFPYEVHQRAVIEHKKRIAKFLTKLTWFTHYEN